MRDDFDAQWAVLAEEVLSGMKEWRLHIRKRRCGRSKGRWTSVWARCGPACCKMRRWRVRRRILRRHRPASGPVCYMWESLGGRAVTARELVTQHNQVLKLERSYGVCPTCGAGLFPPG